MTKHSVASWHIVGAAFLLSAFLAPSPASAGTWSDWRFDAGVDPATKAPAAKAAVVVEGIGDADLYTLGIACAAGKVAVSFESTSHHFKTGAADVTWKADRGKQHSKEPWQVIQGSNQTAFADAPQELIQTLMQGFKLFFGITDAEGQSVNVVFPMVGAKQAIISALSDCRAKSDAESKAVPIEQNIMYLLMRPAKLNYPERAKKAGQTGAADVSYTITEDGKVTDTKVVSENPPGWGFADAALDCVKKWRYKPQIKDGKQVARIGVLAHLTFAPDKPK